MIKKWFAKVVKVWNRSSLRPKSRRSLTRDLVLAFAAILLIYNGVQVARTTMRTIEGISRLIKLTYIDANENDQARIRHPYYTVCPILNKTADLENPNATLVSVMLENSFYHSLVNFLPVLNSAKSVIKHLGGTSHVDQFLFRLTQVERYSTWLKMRPSSKQKDSDSLVLCHTFDIPHNVTLGQTDGFVSDKSMNLSWNYINISFEGQPAPLWQGSNQPHDRI